MGNEIMENNKLFLIFVGIMLFVLIWSLGSSSRSRDNCYGMTERECEAVSEVMGNADRGY